MPLISVIMSVYNEDSFSLKRSLDSIINQTFKDFEIIIVLDNPDNKIAFEIISQYHNSFKNVKYIINEKNLGLPASLNKAIKVANGYFIARQDADDQSLINRLQYQINYISLNKDIGVLGTNLAYIEERTDKLIFIRKYKTTVGREINRYNPLAHPTLLIKKENFEKYGYYDENNSRLAEDYDLWCRWYIQGVKLWNMNDVLYNYYQSRENKKNKNTKKQLIATIKIKLRYATKLKFNLLDYINLLLEISILILPNKAIIKLFYWHNRKKS